MSAAERKRRQRGQASITPALVTKPEYRDSTTLATLPLVTKSEPFRDNVPQLSWELALDDSSEACLSAYRGSHQLYVYQVDSGGTVMFYWYALDDTGMETAGGDAPSLLAAMAAAEAAIRRP
jgi:hypothetical protein